MIIIVTPVFLNEKVVTYFLKTPARFKILRTVSEGCAPFFIHSAAFSESKLSVAGSVLGSQ